MTDFRFLVFLMWGLLLLAGPLPAQTLLGPAPAAPKPLLTPAKTALIQLNNQILFAVHTSGDQVASDRADLANLRLAEALRGVPADRTAAAPQATVGVRDGQTVLLLGPKLLLTVTDADTASTGKPAALLAQSWADSINRALRQAAVERRPAYLREAILWATGFLLRGIAANGGLQVFVRRTGHRPGWPVQALL